jgi:hypothetical protein
MKFPDRITQMIANTSNETESGEQQMMLDFHEIFDSFGAIRSIRIFYANRK